MDIRKLFWSFYLVVSVNGTLTYPSTSDVLEKALIDIMEEFIVKISSTVYIYHDEDTSHRYENICSRLTKMNETIGFKIFTNRELIDFQGLKYPVIALFNSFESIQDFTNNYIFINDRLKSNYYFTYYPKITLEEIITLHSSTVHYQVFVVDTIDDSIALLVSTLFYKNDPDICKLNSVFMLNKLMKPSLKWEKPLKFPKRYLNFNGCPVAIKIMPRLHAINLEFDDTLEHVLSVNGYLVEMIKALSQKMNFYPVYNLVNVSIKSSINQLNERNYYYLELLNAQSVKDVSIFRPIIFADIGFIIPSGKLYPQFMKLILPFTFDLWIATILLFLVAILIVTVINSASQFLQESVYGKGVKTPITNLFSALFGGSQIVVPNRHTPRIILMSFILFSLVIRTAYQGKLFEYLQTEPHEKEVQTIEELIDKNFTFIVPKFFIQTSQMDFLKRFVNDSNN
jgi:hypothetical protein